MKLLEFELFETIIILHKIIKYMNNWNIPDWLEQEVRDRDKKCVYCNTEFSTSEKKRTPTWEHIINDEKIITRENIAICCCSCNASK